MITIKTLENISFTSIYDAFINAFSDYVEPIDLSLEQLEYMITRRGCRLSLSFGAFDNDKLVGFTLNGIGNLNNKLTAYDTGTGVIKEYRKQGIATRMFNESLPILRKNKISQYLLEVIKDNVAAYDLYKKAGFKVTREFDYYKLEKEKIVYKNIMSHNDISFKVITNPDWEKLKSFWDFEPSWQNSIDSINRKSDHFKFLGIYKNAELIGYGIIEMETGDIPQLAISKNYRNLGIATSLFRVLINYSETNSIKIINSESGYNPFRKFAESVGFTPGIGQYEMLLKL